MRTGSYSLVMDTDASLREEALDFLFYCLPHGAPAWDDEHGGATTYLVWAPTHHLVSFILW